MLHLALIASVIVTTPYADTGGTDAILCDFYASATVFEYISAEYTTFDVRTDDVVARVEIELPDEIDTRSSDFEPVSVDLAFRGAEVESALWEVSASIG